jgi:hypothetical protein
MILLEEKQRYREQETDINGSLEEENMRNVTQSEEEEGGGSAERRQISLYIS